MKFHFNERQRFSLRKYSFGLASVFLGTAFFLSGQVASADEPAVSETVTVAETSIQEKTESEQSATTTVETSLEASKDQASSEEKIENHEEKQDNNNSAQASDSNGQDLKNNEELARDEVSRQESEITQSDTHEAKDVEKTIVKTSNQKETNADKETTDSPQNRSRREAPASGWDSSEVDGDNLSFKSVNIPVLPGQYVTRRDINSLKIENDMFDIPWTYNYVIVSKSRYGDDARHRIVNVYYKKLGTISFVDSDGNAISGVNASKVLNNTKNTLTADDGTPVPDPSDAAITELPKIPAGYHLKTIGGDPTKVEAYVDRQTSDDVYDYSEIHTDEVIDPGYLTPDELEAALAKYPAPKISSATWSLNQKETVTLIRQANGSYAIDPTIAGNGGNQFAPGTRYRLVLEKDSTAIQQTTSQTVSYTGATSNPPQNLQDDFIFKGEENNQTHEKTWTKTSHTYGEVSTPVVTGYYADKASAGKKIVTPDQPHATDTVTYKKLGKIIQVDESGKVIENSNSVTYKNNSSDPTQAAETKIPDAPTGYKIKEEQPQAWGYNIVDKTIEPNDESDPDRISRDTPIIYVPIVDKVTKLTKQTVTFEGAGTATPAPDVQSDFTFTGKKKQTDGTTTWDQSSHTYGKVTVPVVKGYYADKAEAGSKVVTPDQPEATDKVTYKPLGNLVPKSDDPKFPDTPKVKYPNDPNDPTKPGKPIVPNVPGYKPYLPDPNYPTKPGEPGRPVEPGKELPNLPTNPGEDTPIIYVPIVDKVTKLTKQTVTFEGAGTATPAPDVQSDFTFTGKKKQTDGTTTWDQSSHTYGKVTVPVVKGYYADKAEAGSKVVTPDQPEATDKVTYKPLGNLVPKSDDPKFPDTPKVKYPNDPNDPTKPSRPVVPNVPGYKPYLPDPNDPTKPDKDKPVEPGKELPNLPTNPGEDTPIIYVPIVDKVTKLTKQTVTFEGAGTATPAPDVQSDFTFTGKKKQTDGTTTWDQSSHTYGKVTVPVVKGYYADKAEAGSKVVTPDQPEATDKVTYKPLGNLVPKSDDPKFPDTPKVKYPNDPNDPTKPGKPIVPNVPGYKPYLPDPNDPTKPDTDKPVEPGKELPNLPTDPGSDTPIVYVPIVDKVTKPTKQTVTFEGAGTATPAPDVQSDFTFTGKKKQADGTITWDQTSHTYGKVTVPVVTGFYADKAEAGSKVVTPDQPEATDKVTYKPLGNLVPKSDDPKFPDTPKVKYPNDPNNPTKPRKPIVPNVPGYKPYLPDPNYPTKPGEPGRPVEPGKELPNLPTNPGEDTPIIYVPIVDKVTKLTKQTVTFEGAGTATPAPDVQSDFTFTGKKKQTDGTTTWDQSSHTYGKVTVPVVKGYYADKAEAGSKVVTPDQPEATDKVTYKPLGNLVPKSDDPKFPDTPKVKYPNDPNDPTKPGKPIVPNVPGYKPYLPDPNYPTKPGEPGRPVEPGKELPNLPTNPGEDTPIIYVPIVDKVTKLTKQTVTFEGAGTATPAPDVQSDFTFTGKKKQTDGTTTWDQSSHTYGKVTVPVVKGYYADKAEAGSKVVTPDQPEATDKVTYKPLGNLVPKSDDPKFPDTPKVKYPNDPNDPTKPGKPIVPNVPGYKPYLPDPNYPTKPGEPGRPVEPGKELPNLPTNPGEDTPIIYVPIVDKVTKLTKQTVTFEGAGTATPAPDVQSDFTFTGKKKQTDGTTTWDQSSHTYGKVTVPVVKGYYADKAEAGSKVVTPDQPEATDKVTYKPLGNLVPKSDDPKFPDTPKVKYPNDPNDPTKPSRPVVPNVPGYKPYLPDPNDPTKPDKDKPVEPGKELPNLPTNPGEDTPIIYVPIVDKVTKLTKQTVTFEGAGTATPAPDVQSDFTFTGKKKQTDGTTTWDQSSHTYGKVTVPVVKGYYADKAEAGSKVVTPDQPEATDKVTYKPLGNLVPKSDDPKFPDTPKVKYPNDPNDPTKPGKPIVPNVPGYKPYLPDPNDPTKPDTDKPVEPGKELPNLPTDPGSDTPIVYVPIVDKVTKPTKQTVTFEGAGTATPAPDVQSDFTFTGKKKQADGTITWDQTSHTYGKVTVPVVTGFYADKAEAGSKVVTPDQPEATDKVTYKPLGNLVPKSDDPKFPDTPKVKYPNDPNNPTKPRKPIVPNVPGYKPYLPDPNYPTKPGEPGRPVEPGEEIPNLPTNPGEDTPIIYVPIVDKVTKPTKQTVTFEGAGTATPAPDVQSDFTFTGKKKQADGTTTWDQSSHTYGKVTVPVVTGFYADKAEAGSKAVTPDQPEATDKVTYKPLGNLVPKSDDPKFPDTPKVKYPNDPNNPTKPRKPIVPNVPGYKPYLPDPNYPTKPGEPGRPVEPGEEIPNLPTNPGEDTPIIYVPIVDKVTKPTKQTVTFEGAGTATPAPDVQSNFTFTGKKKQADGTITWEQSSHTYGKVTVPVVTGFYADKAEAGSKVVTPDQPEASDKVTYKPLGSLVPKSDDPKFPDTPKVKYPNDPNDPTKPSRPVVPNVPGYKPYLPDPNDPTKPDKDKPVEPGKELPNLPTNPGDDTPIIYVPIKPENPTVPTPGPKPEVPTDPTPGPKPETPTIPTPGPKPLDPEKVVQELPNTGTDSNVIMTGLGIVGIATTLLGLAQKKKED